jgi:ice-binding like protein
MKMFEKTAFVALILVVIMAAPADASHIPTVGLGTAGSFAVLAGSGVTNTGATVVKGDLGSHPNNAVTGFPPGTVQNGTINPSYTSGAKDALVTAYNDAAGRTPATTIATELGGQTLTHGVYDSAAGTFGITGTLTLDAQGDANAVWIFKMASTLITASSSNVSLINGASSCNIFWQVGSSATLGTSSTLRGTIMALTSITLTTSASLFGRALARNGSVTLDSDTIDASSCLTAPPSPSDGTTTTTPPGGTTTTPPPGGTTTTTRRRTTTTTGGELPRTGERLPIGPSLALGVGLIAVGLLFNFLGSSSTRPALAVRGYKPRRRACR